jgi:hypothetical protein
MTPLVPLPELLDFKIAIAENNPHRGWLCVNGEFISLDEAKQLRESLMPTKDYVIKARGRRELQLNKQDDGTYQVKVFLRGPDKTLATLVIEQAEMEKLANYSAGLLKK